MSFLNDFALAIQNNPILLVIYSLYTLTLKGFALWKAAKNSNKYWFVAILIINLFGIPELLYIFIFSKRSISFSFLHSQKSNSKK